MSGANKSYLNQASLISAKNGNTSTQRNSGGQQRNWNGKNKLQLIEVK